MILIIMKKKMILMINWMCLVTIDSFLKIVKLGIELKQYKQCIIILKNLINSNDSIGECWALSALCFYKLNAKSLEVNEVLSIQ